jgi:hypothetical protein
MSLDIADYRHVAKHVPISNISAQEINVANNYLTGEPCPDKICPARKGPVRGGALVVEETKIKTNRATEFSKDLVRFLNEHPRFNERHGLTWVRNGMSNEVRLGTVDVVGSTSRGIRVVIEAELLREDPASNVTKLWKWFVENKKRQKKILMIQAFSKVYRGRKYRAKELATFIGERMQKEISGIRYVSKNFSYNPRPGGKRGAGRRRFHARKLGMSVMQIYSKYK